MTSDAPVIISASRRTDLPAFFTPWLMNRFRAGWCEVKNPFNGRIRRVSLRPEDVLAVVFWTRNPEPLLPHLPELLHRGYPAGILFTIVDYPQVLEPFTPAVAASIGRFKQASETLPAGAVIWRYDPILISDLTPDTCHIDRFGTIAGALKGYTSEVIVSFADFYAKVRRRLEHPQTAAAIRCFDPPPEEKIRLAETLRDIARENGMRLSVCCEPELTSAGLPASQCIGPPILNALFPNRPVHVPPKPTRPGCGCVESVDIGAYDTCAHGCLYCYATGKRGTVLKRIARHDPMHPCLIPDP